MNMLFGKKKKASESTENWRDWGKDPAFDKLWKKAGNYKADSMLALESYCSENTTAPWYGFFLLAAAYDCNACGLPFDMEKAERYYSLAEEGVKKMPNSAALSFFTIYMEYRNYEPGNLLVDLTPLTRQIRRTGLAAVATNIAPVYQHYNQTVEEGNTNDTRENAMYEAQYNKKEIIYSAPISWYSFFNTIPYQYKLFGKNTTENIELEHTIQPLIDYFLTYTSTINTQKDEFKYLNKLIKDTNSMIKTLNDYSAEKVVSELGESVYDDYKYLIMGKALELAKTCPFDYVQLAAQQNPYYPYRTAWSMLTLAIRLGSVAAAADLAVFLNTEYWSNQFSEFIVGKYDEPGLTNSQKLGRDLLKMFGTPLVYASYTGKQHAFDKVGGAIDFCFQYFAPFGDHDTLAKIMNSQGWPAELLADEASKLKAAYEDLK